MQPQQLWAVRCVFPKGEERLADDDLKSIGRTIELEHIRKVVQECGGDQGEAARRLGISRTTLWRKLNGRHKGSHSPAG